MIAANEIKRIIGNHLLSDGFDILLIFDEEKLVDNACDGGKELLQE